MKKMSLLLLILLLPSTVLGVIDLTEQKDITLPLNTVLELKDGDYHIYVKYKGLAEGHGRMSVFRIASKASNGSWDTEEWPIYKQKITIMGRSYDVRERPDWTDLKLRYKH